MRNRWAVLFSNMKSGQAGARITLLSMALPCLLTAGFFEFEFSPVWRAEYPGVLARDLDADGVDELVMSRKNNDTDLWGVSCTDITGGARWQYWPQQRTEAVDAVDIDSDGELEVIARERAGDSAFLLIFTKDGRLEERMKVLRGTDINDSGDWDGFFGFKGAVDLNGDGKKELFLSAGTSFDLEPRGVFVIDPSSGKELWHYWVGFYPSDIKFDDLDADGDLEIVMGGASPANGGQMNGTDDIHTYVFVLDHQGRHLWSKQIGGVFSRTGIEIADFNKDGKKEIVVIETTDNGDFYGQDRIFILDGATGDQEKVVKKGHTYKGSLLCDINKDGVPEIVVGNTDGVLRAYDRNLKEVARFKYGTGIKACDSGDIDDDGRPEIIAASQDGKLHILNASLSPMGSFEVGGGYEVGGEIVSDKGKFKEVLFFANQPDGEVEYYLLKMSKKLSNQAIILIIVSPLVLALFVTGGLIIPVLYRRNKLFRKTLDKSSSGIILLSNKGLIRIFNKTARDIFGITKEITLKRHFKVLDIDANMETLRRSILESICLEEPRRGTITVDQGEKERLVEVQTFKTGTKIWLVSLSDVTEQEYGRRVATLMPVAQQLAHGIKNPLNNIKLALGRLQKFIATSKERQDEAAKYSLMATEEAERLVKLTNGFMRFTKLEMPEFKSVALELIVKEVVDRFKQMLSSGIEISVVTDRNLPKLMLDRAQISIAIDHLVDNAIAAITGKGKVTIKASLREEALESGKTKGVEISVSDTGAGIPLKYKNRIFEPYFSLKEEGTGLGLCMVKKLIENHNGTVNFNSEEGQGTTFTIRLPL